MQSAQPRLEVPVRVRGDDGLADHVGRAGKEVVVREVSTPCGIRSARPSDLIIGRDGGKFLVPEAVSGRNHPLRQCVVALLGQLVGDQALDYGLVVDRGGIELAMISCTMLRSVGSAPVVAS